MAYQDAKPRRSHRKSRNGCATCKARHVKCDETRPTCISCSVSERQCVYTTSAPSRSSSRSIPLRERSPSSQTSPTSSAAAHTPQSSSCASSSGPGNTEPEHAPPAPEADEVYTINHLALLHYIETGLGDFMQSSISSSNLQPKVVIEAALKAPYLMNELLALAALHLSQSSLHRHDLQQEAATLQTRALSSFNKAKQQVSEDNCIPLFLFSSFLGLHMLCDTIQNRQDSFSSFLDQFMVYLDIHRGVSAVTSQSWPLIKRSEFGPSIQRIESALHCDESSDGDETQILHRMISDTYLSPASAKAYRATLTVLQSCLNLYHRLEEEGLRPSEAPIAFCITVNDEYVGFLKQRQPEALVILAYYAVMLYRCRDFWIFGDGGEYLIRSISAHLGAHGADWLAWPNSFLE
ncbi:hypothetical protein ACJZ2D_000989 [Fusarium nematophilum]